MGWLDKYQDGGNVEVPDNFLLKQAFKESSFDPNAVSKAGYKGLTQIGDKVIIDYKKKTDAKNVNPFDIDDAIAVQKWYMNDLYNASFNQNPDDSEQEKLAKASAAYNYGRGKVARAIHKKGDKWLEDMPNETKDYIDKLVYNNNETFEREFDSVIKLPKHRELLKKYNYNAGHTPPFTEEEFNNRNIGKGLDKQEFYEEVRNSRPIEGFENEDGSISSHLMADDNERFAYPTLFYNPDGTWSSYNNPKEEARRRGELYEFDNKEDLIGFAREGNWKQNQYNDGGIIKAQKGVEFPADGTDEEKKQWYKDNPQKETITQGSNWLEKFVDRMASPFTSVSETFGKASPVGMKMDSKHRSAYDDVIDMVNPFSWYKYLRQSGEDLEQGNYLDSGLNFLAGMPIVPTAAKYTDEAVKPFAGITRVNKQKPIKDVNPGTGKYVDKDVNMDDLLYAQQFADKYGYIFPENLKRIADSDHLTDMSIKGLMDRHNSFARGVSTNWELIQKRNPEILLHLENKGIDWKANPREAAEYMATHIPINTGYGRASLGNDIFRRGQDGLYSSNSFKTAEGYTYGDGYVVKAKLPTDYSSKTRKDWIDKNLFDYNEHSYPKSRTKREVDENVFMFTALDPERSTKEFIGKENSELVKNANNEIQNFIEKVYKKYNINMEEGSFHVSPEEITKAGGDEKLARRIKSENVFKAEEEIKDFTKRTKKTLKENLQKFDNPELPKKILKTEHIKKVSLKNKTTLDDIYNTSDEMGLSRIQANNLRNNMHDIAGDIRSNGGNIEDIKKSLKNFLKSEMKKYAHYIHIGTPGEKVLKVVNSRKITPEAYKNKSRAHTNKYSKGLSAGAISALSLGTTKGVNETINQETSEELDKYQGGGIIEDDKGQWAHPGKITKINSNNITMKGVNYPVLGISDEGDEQIMYPEGEYTFKGKNVTEIPLKAQNGGWLDKYN